MSAARPSSLRSIGHVLADADLPVDVRTRVSRQPYREALLDLVPLDILAAVDVMQIREGVVWLRADSPAVATRLRQVQARVRRGLVERGLVAESLKIKVASPHHRLRAVPAPPPRRPLPDKARQSLEAVAARMPDGPLRDAVRRLANSADPA